MIDEDRLTRIDQEDELLLDAPNTDLTAVSTATGDADDEMHIDEEGRPRFAPAKNTVRRFLPYTYNLLSFY